MPAVSRVREVDLRHFEEACQLLRHYSSLRFKQLTIFTAINGGLLYVLFRQAGPVLPFEVYSCVALGILAASAFLLLEFRLTNYLDHYRDIVGAYERRFGLNQALYDIERRGRLIRGRLAVFLFIASAIGFWLAVGALSAVQ